MECVSSTSYSIRINGELHGMFKGKRRLRQGDRLLPYLFVMCMEYLSRLLRRNTKSGFNFYPRCGVLKISHLIYADDLMMLSRGDLKSVETLWGSLLHFGEASGLLPNIQKSQIFMAGVEEDIKERITEYTGIPQGMLPIRYLGIPLASEGLRVVHYAPLIEAITTQIGLWTASSLSYAGRLELIKSVLQGIHCFWLSTMPVPMGVIDRVVSLRRRFLWDGRKALVVWRDLSLPKEEGGLGVRDAKMWNKPLLAKVIWNIHGKKDSLWVRWIHHIYLQITSIWEMSTKKDLSALMKRLLTIRDCVVKQEGTVQGAMGRMDTWKGEKLCQTTYEYFRRKQARVVWAGIIWAKYIPPKYSFIVWLAIRGRLLTKDRLEYLQIDPTCGLCGIEEESVHHLFFACPFSKSVWEGMREWCGMRSRMTTLLATVKHMKREARGTTWLSRRRRLALSCTVYYIWITRNRLLFEHLYPNIQDIVYRIKTHVYRVGYSLYPSVSILH